jgi:hypothetical protein
MFFNKPVTKEFPYGLLGEHDFRAMPSKHITLLCRRVHSCCCSVISFLLLRGSVVVKALCYKPEGRGVETRWGEWFLSSYLILPVALEYTQPLTEMSTRSIKIMFLGSKAAAGA